jgi:hypothetical protein
MKDASKPPGGAGPATPGTNTVATIEPKSDARAAGAVAPADSRPQQPGPALKFEVQVPGDVQVGQSFQATVNVDANRGVRRLTFSVNYRKTVLQLQEMSAGTFIPQGGVSAQSAFDEPSDGVVLVNLDVNNGAAIAGAGSVAVLTFMALKPGTSPVTVQEIGFVEQGRTEETTTSLVRQGTVNVQ